MLMNQFGLPKELQDVVKSLLSKDENEQRSAIHSVMNDMLISRIFDFFNTKVAEKNAGVLIHIMLTKIEDEVFVNAVSVDNSLKLTVIESYKLSQLIAEIPLKKMNDGEENNPVLRIEK